jgi:hypothetical protein
MRSYLLAGRFATLPLPRLRGESLVVNRHQHRFFTKQSSCHQEQNATKAAANVDLCRRKVKAQEWQISFWE